MNPFDIIEVPWQRGTFGRRALIELLDKAGRPRANSMLRLKDEQQRAWDAYQGGWGNPADDPNRPESFELGHVRGIAVDIDTSSAMTARLKAVGLVRPFSWESWHWRLNVNVRDWPLVEFIPAVAGEIVEDDMFDVTDRNTLNELKSGLEELKALVQNAPRAEYSLIRLRNRPEVFLSTNRTTLLWLKTEKDRDDMIYTLRGANAPAANRPIEEVDNLDAYGTIIGDRPVGY
ncbi:endolysin [Microbacterium phage LuzDeMundo]|nr:endolysin [Microbacterium phage LuzDeMundo]